MKLAAVAAVVLVMTGLLVGGVYVTRRYDQAQQPQASATVGGVQKLEEGARDVTQLQVEDLAVGTGEVAVAGKKVSVHYVGTLVNGQKFDSSVDRGQPFEFGLGSGQVIKGWDQGVAGMKVGGKRKLTIPPQLAYGDSGAGSAIPPGATLIFEVELLAVQ